MFHIDSDMYNPEEQQLSMIQYWWWLDCRIFDSSTLHNCWYRPDPAVQVMNELLVSMTIGDGVANETQLETKRRAAFELMKVDNGDWTHPGKIVHYCKGLHCCPHGIRETRAKLWTAILVSSMHDVYFVMVQSIRFDRSANMWFVICVTSVRVLDVYHLEA